MLSSSSSKKVGMIYTLVRPTLPLEAGGGLVGVSSRRMSAHIKKGMSWEAGDLEKGGKMEGTNEEELEVQCRVELN